MKREKVYSEVYSIINELGEDFSSKIPKNIYEFIENFRDKDYNPKYNLNVSFKRQNISKDSIALICVIHTRYWTKNANKIKKINNILEGIEDTKFENKIEDRNQKDLNKDTEKQSVIVYKESIFDKLIAKYLGI